MPRIHSLDLARGFTVFIMPAAHVLLLYSKPELQGSLLSAAFRFLAEGPGAQLFMLLMGISFVFNRHKPARYFLQRAFYLLLMAYCLNFFKFVVPIAFGFMPDNLLVEFNLSNDLHAALFFLLMGDILHFAAIAYLVLYFISRLKNYPYWSIAFAIAIVFLSPFVWDVKTGNIFVDQLIILFNGHPPNTFFPAFPWLVYPLVGLTLGSLLKQYRSDEVLKKTGIAGMVAIIISLLLPSTTTITPWPAFYRTEPADTIFHWGFVLMWLSVLHYLSKKIPPNPLFRLLSFCSRHITLIYIIQWVLICWCMAFTGYGSLNMGLTIGWMASITIVTLLLTYLISHATRKSI